MVVAARIFAVGMLSPDKGFQVSLKAIYNPDEDPLAVKLVFQAPGEEEVPWLVSRELLLRGSTSLEPYGDGDLKLRYEGEGSNSLVLCLRSDGHLDVKVNHRQMVAFLDKTCEAVKFGEEDFAGRLDEFLEELFG